MPMPHHDAAEQLAGRRLRVDHAADAEARRPPRHAHLAGVADRLAPRRNGLRTRPSRTAAFRAGRAVTACLARWSPSRCAIQQLGGLDAPAVRPCAASRPRRGRSCRLGAVPRRAGVRDGQRVSLLARLAAGSSLAADAGGLSSSRRPTARPAGPSHRGDPHGVQRHAERVRRDLRQCGRRTHAHLLRCRTGPGHRRQRDSRTVTSAG